MISSFRLCFDPAQHTTSFSMGILEMVLMESPDSRPWDTMAYTPLAPAACSVEVAKARVSPVSHMSSIRMAIW